MANVIVSRLRIWLGALRGSRMRPIVLALVLALGANVWVLNPAAAGNTTSSDVFDPMADTAAIISVAEDADSVKNQLDNPDEWSHSLAYPDSPNPRAGAAGAGPEHAVKSHDRGGLPHKTGPPAHV